MGRHSGGFGARLRPMDMLKIGQLYLQQGRWNGKQLIAADFVKLSMPVDGVHEGRYGLMWWLGKNPDLGDLRFFFANGRKGQRIYVFPDWDMVVAVVATLTAEDEQLMLRPLLRGLKAAVGDAPEPRADEEARQKLLKMTEAGFHGARSFAEAIDVARPVSDR